MGLKEGLIPAWEAFLAGDDAPRGGNLYEAVFENNVIFPLQRKREMAAMQRRAGEIAPRVVLEIGADKGGSFYHWIKCQPSVDLAIAVEINGAPYVDLFRKHFPDVEIYGLGGSSYAPEIVRGVRAVLGDRPIDVVFLDGDKSAFDRDLRIYRELVRPGGLVFIHDIQDAENPARTFFEIAGGTETIIDTSELADVELRERAGAPPASAYEGWFRIWRARSCGVGVLTI